jgi:ribosomal protein S18 acetylase RimI-like enzyme
VPDAGFRYTARMAQLRPYRPDDWTRFLDLELETQVDALGDSTELERTTLRERFPALLDVKMGFSRLGFRRPGAQLWVVEDEGKYLGHLWLTERDDAVHGTRTLEVTTMGIVRDARGKGLGRLLMHKAEEEAKARGIEVIELSVAGNNRRARDMYKDLGYQTIRRSMQKRLTRE